MRENPADSMIWKILELIAWVLIICGLVYIVDLTIRTRQRNEDTHLHHSREIKEAEQRGYEKAKKELDLQRTKAEQ
ncbi:MAG: hypothetical protein HYZ63_03265 [Candidatus Andersenbacteria bacterium]|nr:hypothetical protein [Candidatus Andersenbacteria bacterium]